MSLSGGARRRKRCIGKASTPQWTVGKASIPGCRRIARLKTQCRKVFGVRLASADVDALRGQVEKSHFFIFSHWGIGQSWKIKMTTQASQTSQRKGNIASIRGARRRKGLKTSKRSHKCFSRLNAQCHKRAFSKACKR